MANKKITALENLPSPAGADILPIVDDVSGTPTTKKVTATNLMTLAPVQSVAGRTGTVTLSNSDISGLGTAATSASTDFSPAFFTTVAESTTARTLSDSDNGKVIVCSNSSPTIVTIPSGLTTGFGCTVVQSGTGTVTVAGSSTTINGFEGKTATAGQYAALNVIPVGSNAYIVEGDSTIAPLVNGFSVNFDKTDDFCGVSSDPGLDVYSMSLWFKASTTITNSYAGTLVGGVNSVYGGIRIGMGANRTLEYNDGNQYIAAGNTSTIDTNWHNLIMVYVNSGYTTTTGTASNNGKGYKLFLDGSRVDTALGSTSYNFALATSTSKLKLAREGERALYFFGGLIDEFAIFGSSLSDADVSAIYNSGVPTDLTSYSPTLWWRMGDNDSGTGTTITDQGSGSNDGTLTNGPTFSTTVPS